MARFGPGVSPFVRRDRTVGDALVEGLSELEQNLDAQRQEENKLREAGATEVEQRSPLGTLWDKRPSWLGGNNGSGAAPSATPTADVRAPAPAMFGAPQGTIGAIEPALQKRSISNMLPGYEYTTRFGKRYNVPNQQVRAAQAAATLEQAEYDRLAPRRAEATRLEGERDLREEEQARGRIRLEQELIGGREARRDAANTEQARIRAGAAERMEGIRQGNRVDLARIRGEISAARGRGASNRELVSLLNSQLTGLRMQLGSIRIPVGMEREDELDTEGGAERLAASEREREDLLNEIGRITSEIESLRKGTDGPITSRAPTRGQSKVAEILNNPRLSQDQKRDLIGRVRP